MSQRYSSMRWNDGQTKMFKVVKFDQGGEYCGKFDENGQNLDPFAKLLQS